MKTRHTLLGWLAALILFLNGSSSLSAQTQNAPDTTVPSTASQSPSDGTAANENTSDKVLVFEAFKVTGSYIKHNSFEETGAPVVVLSLQDMLDTGAVSKVSDFMKAVPQNVGTWAGGGNTGGSDADTNFGGASVNLRGLGSGATLVLLNGFRAARNPVMPDGRVDINSLAPQIALQRTEILKNGASSLYGSDAVAGVVNFITRDDFNGEEIQADFGTFPSYTASYRMSQGLIFGGQVNDKLHLMAAFQYAKQTPLTDGMTGVAAANAATMSSSLGWPGNMRIPVRDASGAITGLSTTFADPDTGRISQQNITVGNPPGIGTDTYLINGVARMVWKSYAQVWEETRYSGRAAVKYKISPDVTFTGSVGTANATSLIPTTATGPVTQTVFVVPGINPGNTFRAKNSLGQPLYAVPNPANPTTAQLDSKGNAVLTSDPTNPASGVPFNENVSLVQFRPYSTTNGPLLIRHDTTRNFRTDAGFEGKFNQNWSWNVHWTYSDQFMVGQGQDAVISAVNAGLNGQLGPNHNQWYNPFGNSVFAAPGSPQYNSPDIYNDIVYLVTNSYEATLNSFDGVITGNVAKLPAGPLGLAIGAQRRSETLDQIFDKGQVAGLLAQVGPGVPEIAGRAGTTALFSEASVPLVKGPVGRLDLSASGRYEKDNWNNSFTPKVALAYKKAWLDLHASYGTAFQSPSLYQRFGNSFAGGVPITDPVSNVATQAVTTTIGSANAKPQKSKAFDAGFTIAPNKNLSLGVDYWNFNFTDLISTLTAQAQVNTAVGSNPNVYRDPTSGLITKVYLPYFNAGSVKTDGVDFDLGYNMNAGDIGHFNFTASATELLSYKVQTLPTSAVYNGLGTDNSNNFGFPMPKWRAVAGIAWDRKGHAISINARYIGGVIVSTAPTQSANTQTKIDVQYSYQFEQKSFLKGLRMNVGILNVFNQLPNVIPAKGGQAYVHNLQDSLPRSAHVTFTYSF